MFCMTLSLVVQKAPVVPYGPSVTQLTGVLMLRFLNSYNVSVRY